MTSDRRRQVTGILDTLGESGGGGPEAAELLPAVYDELRHLARGYLRGAQAGPPFSWR